jgi:hypothetical protein
VIPVSNCDDDGPGSLRYTIKNVAASDDAVDLRALDCSVISLTTGAINIAQASLKIVGPGSGRFTITANRNSQVFYHFGRGDLEVQYLKVKYGSTSAKSNYALGGCIYSTGNVRLYQTTVTGCEVVVSGTAFGRGGGVFALGGIDAQSSVIEGNRVDGRASGNTVTGGGLDSGGTMLIVSSTVSGNAVLAAPTRLANGGGAHALGALSVLFSTITGNSANYGGGLAADAYLHVDHSTLSANSALAGGAVFASYAVGETVSFWNSTVSGNAAQKVGGIAVYAQALSLTNTTVAFNTASNAGRPAGVFAGGPSATLNGTIVANNTSAGVLADFVSDESPVGALNLITSDQPMPGFSINSCPRLAPLADNGGQTLTHALGSQSAARDAGNNVLQFDYDQRGQPRIQGGGPDIGAFESDTAAPDLIFRGGFQNRCD